MMANLNNGVWKTSGSRKLSAPFLNNWSPNMTRLFSVLKW